MESVGACAAKYVWRRAREPLAVFGLHVLLGVLYRLVFGCVFLKAAAGARRRGVRDEVSESLVVTRVVERRETRRTREATLKRAGLATLERHEGRILPLASSASTRLWRRSARSRRAPRARGVEVSVTLFVARPPPPALGVCSVITGDQGTRVRRRLRRFP